MKMSKSPKIRDPAQIWINRRIGWGRKIDKIFVYYYDLCLCISFALWKIGAKEY